MTLLIGSSYFEVGSFESSFSSSLNVLSDLLHSPCKVSYLKFLPRTLTSSIAVETRLLEKMSKRMKRMRSLTSRWTGFSVMPWLFLSRQRKWSQVKVCILITFTARHLNTLRNLTVLVHRRSCKQCWTHVVQCGKSRLTTR